ncbi:MAG: D-alanine--D-alanine ligase [Clostridiales bacterium]|nr:D-alanine--D-alanine ligase [Clostridiales bacterium]
MNIVVLAGGYSPERDVSLCSGCLIANALIENGHQVLLLDAYLGMELQTSIPELFHNLNSSEKYEFTIPEKEPDLDELKQLSRNGKSLIGKNVLEICKYADKVFIALHGSIGENGQLQALFDLYGIDYTGSAYTGSLLAMDKDITKTLFHATNIATPAWKIYDITKPEFDLNAIPLPCVIKPCSCGSSVGVSIVHTKDELIKAINYARIYENCVMFEQLIKGREFSIGILNQKALPPIEIIPKQGFYDYTNKYQTGLTTEICPAIIDSDLCDKMQQAALRVHEVLHLGYYSRVDFILDDTGEFYCLEANTLPGMTPTSLLPQEAKAAGIDYHKLCEMILNETK